jgi:Fic family protein
MSWKPSNLPYDVELETKIVLKKLTSAHRALAELKGLARSLPQQDILINMLTFQEAKDSSEVENIVTTHDELYKSSLTIENYISPATKEVQNYGSALKKGYDIVKTKKILTINTIIEIQSVLEKNYAGLRKMPGTNLKNQKGEIIFEPPQDSQEIISLMSNLEKFINDTTISDYDPTNKITNSLKPFIYRELKNTMISRHK